MPHAKVAKDAKGRAEAKLQVPTGFGHSTEIGLTRLPKWNNHKEHKGHKAKELGQKYPRVELSTGSVAKSVPLFVFFVVHFGVRI